MTEAKAKNIEGLAQAVLDARASFSNTPLEVLYDADNMPPQLRKAHENLDRAVDRLYRRSSFRFERERVEHLFQLFEKATVPLHDSKGGRRNRKPAWRCDKFEETNPMSMEVDTNLETLIAHSGTPKGIAEALKSPTAAAFTAARSKSTHSNMACAMQRTRVIRPRVITTKRWRKPVVTMESKL